MKALLLLTLILTAPIAHAGGPVIVEDTAETAAPARDRDGAIALALLGVLVVAVLIGGSGNCNSEPVAPVAPGRC